MALELSRLVELVGRVRATPRKTEKVGLIADVLRDARGREAELLALYLSGTLAQGRIGIGYRLIQAAESEAPREGAPLTLLDLDEALERLAAEQARARRSAESRRCARSSRARTPASGASWSS